jgi:N-acetylmuramoyl-L-alanine amidase
VALAVLAGLSAPGLDAQDRPLIYIDPGHGGEQSGVVADGIHEKDLVLRWGFLLAEALAAAGYETRMSRTGDVTRGFQERVDEAEAAGAALFISLHINGDDDPELWGTEIFLAEELPESVRAAEAMAAELGGIGARVTLIGQPWDVLKSEAVPSVMVELGHLTNPVERRLMVSRDFWEEASMALVRAVDALVGRPGT